ncbi:MAG: hypothetical protein FJ215_05555 [Ignavibacteria bacterium]|nr:hypothetical protein [Ignavibacteria bacterium]
MNQRLFLLILLMVMIPGFGYSQDWLEFSGYGSEFPIYQRLNETLARLSRSKQDQFANVGRIRLRPRATLWSGAFFSLEYEIISAYIESPVNIFTSGDKSRRQIVDLTWNPISTPNHSLVHFVDRLFVRQSLGAIEITLGRQRISWGSGRFWNPTDLFNPLNPTVFSKIEKDGIDGLLVKLFLGSFSDLSVVYNPEDNLKNGNVGARIRSNISEFDLSVVGGRFDDRMIVGGDFAGNFFDAGIRGEILVASSRNRDRPEFLKYVFGLDHQFTPDVYALFEFHFNGEGKSETQQYEMSRLLAGEVLNVGRQYLLLQSIILVHPLVSLSVVSLSNIGDRSGMLGGSVTYAWTNECTVGMGGQLFYGNDLTEYWYYPKTLYVRADLFF